MDKGGISSWGLDSLYFTFVKLPIQQVLQLKVTETYGTSFSFRHHPIFKVEICGIVVGTEIKSNKTRYIIDDGSGIVHCIRWRSISSFIEAPELECSLGDTVVIRGKLSHYWNNIEINVLNLRLIQPIEEVEQWLTQAELYTSFYSTYQLPLNIVEAAKDWVQKQKKAKQNKN
eukprot:GCRY01001662.1.p1 GENE.GCRY01001662.1~~GCRY01001662.1.p1  ORF type:complete len:173 (+),score=3.74 GCRY01001662.1:269-787(+)